MKQYIGLFFYLVCIPFVWADEPALPTKMVLDKVLFQITSKQWVSTQTALLDVSINVTLNSADLVKARADIMGKLTKIAAGDWHLLEFNRSQDSSGLEKLHVQAQARVSQAVLTSVYQQAKAVSVPGAQYTISGVEFKPSLEENQAVKAKVREALYKSVNEELGRINAVYPSQHYTVSQVLFVEGDLPPIEKPYQEKMLNTMAMVAPAAATTVSNELVLTAIVTAASNRKEGA